MQKFKYIIFLFLFGILTLFNNTSVVEAFTTLYEFNYIGDVQEFIVPVNGTYKLEVWGAGGGGQHQASYSGIGGLGGYSQGLINLKKGDTLCIIEAMKLMNEIESEFDGEIKEILVKDGESVEYGKPLFRIV